MLNHSILPKMYYPTRYIDKHGTVETVLYNDGKVLSMTIRGVLFRGCDFDSLEPVNYELKSDLETFIFQHDELCNCIIECKIPIIISGYQIEDSFATLEMRLDLGKPDHRNAIDKEDLSLKLRYNSKEYGLEKIAGDFESGLIQIGKQLSDGAHLKCCFTCMYSDYSPLGQGLFGSMACFRDNKKEYLKCKEKQDFFLI